MSYLNLEIFTQPLSLSEGFEMTNADLVVVPAGKEYFSS